MNDYLNKPIDFPLLVGTLLKWILARDPSEPVSPDLTELLPRLRVLTRMLYSGQSKARGFNQEIETLLAGSSLKKTYLAIAEPISRLDFDTALDKLRALAKTQEWDLS